MLGLLIVFLISVAVFVVTDFLYDLDAGEDKSGNPSGQS
jgi:hypothetical protein